jgi:hypothetical protein
MWDPFAVIPWSALRFLQMVSTPLSTTQCIRLNRTLKQISSILSETFLDTARGGLANLAARIRARTGQALTFDTESELFHDWSGVKVIRHQTAAEKYPEQIQELLERAHNKLADRNEYAEKIANKQRVVERLMFMVQQSRHDIKHNKQSLQEVDRSMEKDKAKAAELEAKYNISFDMIEAKKYRPYKASRRSCLVALLWDVDHLHCSSSHYRP